MAGSAVQIHFKGLQRLQRRLKYSYPKIYRPAMSAALNRTTTTVRAQAARDIKAEIGPIRIGRIKKELIRRKATTRTLSATIYSKNNVLGTIHFGARQLKKGVSHREYGKRRLLKGAFIAKVRPGAGFGDDRVAQVFYRKTDRRLPLQKLWGPGIARTMGRDPVKSGMLKTVDDNLFKNLKAQIRWRANRN